MAAFRPRFITFDCYGTLNNFQMSHLTSTLFSDWVPPDPHARIHDRLQRLSPRRSPRGLEALCRGDQAGLASLLQTLGPSLRPGRGPAPVRGHPHLGPASRRPGAVGQSRAGFPARYSVERVRQPDPPQRGETWRAVPCRVHGRAGAGLQAPPLGLRIPDRPAGLRPAELLHVSSTSGTTTCRPTTWGFGTPSTSTGGTAPPPTITATPRCRTWVACPPWWGWT